MELRDLIDSILTLIISNNFTQILNVLAQIPNCGSCSLALLDVFQFSFPGFYFAGNFPHFGKYLHISTRVSYNFSSNLGLGTCWNWCTCLSSYVLGYSSVISMIVSCFDCCYTFYKSSLFCSNSIFFDINGNIENTRNLPNLMKLLKQKSVLNPRK